MSRFDIAWIVGEYAAVIAYMLWAAWYVTHRSGKR